MTRVALVIAMLAACAAHPGKNEVVATVGRDTKWKSPVTKATFDGNLTVIALGPHVTIVIASCYAHAQQKIGDHDHVKITVDGKDATSGELDITDCTTKHVIATLQAVSAAGLNVEAAIDSDLVKP